MRGKNREKRKRPKSLSLNEWGHIFFSNICLLFFLVSRWLDRFHAGIYNRSIFLWDFHDDDLTHLNAIGAHFKKNVGQSILFPIKKNEKKKRTERILVPREKNNKNIKEVANFLKRKNKKIRFRRVSNRSPRGNRKTCKCVRTAVP